jgi:hypothetical protein
MTTEKRKLYELPEPSTASVTDANLQVTGKIGVLKFDYVRDGTPYRSGVKFLGVVATRTFGERSCTVWHIEQCYDALCEVENSDWIDEIRGQMPDRYKSEFNVRHFMIYLDSAGCFEVLAESFENLKEELGSWEPVKQNLAI